MIESWLVWLSELISQNIWLAPFIALFAGLLTSFMPCSLSSIPLVIGYVGGVGERDTRQSFKLSLVFALGMTITFTILGTLAALLGRIMQGTSQVLFIALGILMVLMALQIWGVFTFIPSTQLTSKNKKRGYLGAFLAGILGGVFSSPCSTPVLIALLAIVSQSGNIAFGVVLLMLYSAGHSVLVVIAGTSYGFAQKLMENEKYGKFSAMLTYVMGALVLLIGLYMFWLGF